MAKRPPRTARKAEGGKKFAVIGGRLEDDNDAVYAQMHRLSGGRILVFSTASMEPVEVGEETVAAFVAQGFEAEAIPLYASNAAQAAHDPAIVARIAKVKHVFFTGGDQANILNALAPGGVETPVLCAIRAAHDAGGLMAGSSAGAAMMSQPMLLGGTSLESTIHGVTRDAEAPGLLVGDGLGFFGFGLVDQHFIKRGRLARLVVALAHSGIRYGFGIDENTALIVEGGYGTVCGEYGMMVVDLDGADIDASVHSYRGFNLSYLDDGDRIDLSTMTPYPGGTKRRVLKRQRAYRAPIRSRRNVFGAYTLYDLLARLVLREPKVYRMDRADAFDARSGHCVEVSIETDPETSRGLIATPDSGLRMTALNFRCSITAQKLSATGLADRTGRQTRAFGMEPLPESKIVLLGSSPLRGAPELLELPLGLIGDGPVGVLASASAEARRTASEHVEMLRKRGIEAVDLGVTIDTVEYAAHDADLLERVAGMRAILLCGGNQIRLVETLLHRGEESALLRAIARCYVNGGVILAASGAASALSGMMIAGGSSYEALRYGVASDLGHQGLVIQEGIGMFSGGIVDQNLLSGKRLARLVVACAEETERFGIGVMEDSSVIISQRGTRLEAAGKHGFVLVEIDPMNLQLNSDNFVANGVRITVLGPGDVATLGQGSVERAEKNGPSPDAVQGLLRELIGGLADEAKAAGGHHGGSFQQVEGIAGHDGAVDPATAVINLECPRDENA